ncbi:sigma factor-like helix-turn-helix DNA-binding protein [Streptomyces sp. NPDC017936]|uniref:sigma factor-like helix-turn-helix DNA-binding protein n=1 Tax=Streptomyces sp. NPDC017936 TaxID=3365016 RepID=UPI0037963BAB
MRNQPGMPLTPRQAEALTTAATGATLRQVADEMGITREHVSMLLSNAYRRLDVTYLPRDQRRAAAVRIARRRGLIPAPNASKETA